MKSINLLLIAILLLVNYVATAQIVGDTGVCKGDIKVYHVPVVAGATYAWSVTSGTVQGAANLDSVTVLWNTVGTGTIITTIYNPSGPPTYYTLNVHVRPKPVPHISHVPYPTCPVDTGRGNTSGQADKAPCDKVCKLSTVTYNTNPHAGNTYAWVVSGASAVAGASTSSVTVTWDSSAFGNITVYETNVFGCTDSFTLCIIKVNLPAAGFTHLANVCRNSSTLFTNTSTGATAYQWFFGDGGTSSQVNPTHQYTSAGSYTVTLVAENDCHCTDTFSSVIQVDSLPGPTIACPATVCAHSTATYSTASGMGCVYHWFVTGGTILSGQLTPSVTVQWGLGQLGTLGLYITGCGAVCSDTTIVQIPIVPATATISGATKVCAGDCEYYSIPHFSGATYHWTIGSGCGTINDSTCCEKVQVCWSNNAYNCTDTLTVTYYDSLLHCGGSGQIIINLKPNLTIGGSSPTCANATGYYGASGGAPCFWTISPSGPTYFAGPSTSLNVNWNNVPGNYIITAYAANTSLVCNDSAKLLVKVVPPPVKPIITGDTIICPNSSVSYCATGTANVNWLVTGGTPTAAIGNCITVNWGTTGPFIVKAFQKNTLSPFCSSDTAVQNVHLSTAGAPTLTGATTACANATNTYSTATLYPNGTTYAWSLNPSNAGAILSPNGTTTQIQWGNNAPQNVTVTFTATACGTPYSGNIVVSLKPAPNPTVNQIGSLCAGGTAQLQAVGGAYFPVNWSGPSGYNSTTNPTTITVDGLYQVTVTDINGCQAHTQKTVTYVSGPTASISTADPVNYCTGTPFTVNICALGNPNYTYSWSNGATTQCNAVSTPGNYSVTVIDVSNGCTATSTIIGVSSSPCTGTGGGGCTPNPSATISFTHNTCNPMTFTNTSVSDSSFSWAFGDGTFSNTTSPTHTYASAGFYLVVLNGNVPNNTATGFCLLQDTAHIEIPLAAKFDAVAGCNGTPVCFTDKSTYTAGNSITSWSWNFGDATPTSTAQNPCHTYALPGTYTVVLTITNGVCTDTYTQTVVVPNPPTAAFTFTNPNCINTPVSFTDGSVTSINYWNWNFGDAGTSLNQNPAHTYVTAASYPVTLIVSNTAGCRDTVLHNVVISSPSLTGNITAYPDTVVCAGTPVLLVAPYCPTCTYLWNTGATNDSITVTTTGIYSVTITDGNGCPYSTFIRIIVNNGPPAVITSSKGNNICLGDFSILSVPYNTNWTYNWSTNDLPSNGSTSYSIYCSPVAAGIYHYQVIIKDTTSGCSDTSAVFILNVHAPPVPPTITAVGPTTVCHGDTILLIGSHPDTTVTLQWNTGTAGDSLFVTENGCYQLQATDTNGCKSKAISCATVNPVPETCMFFEGCLDTCAPFTIHGPTGNTSYQWLLNGSPIGGATQPTYTASVAGVYSVIVTNNFGCTDTTGTLNLSLHPCDTLCSQLLIDSIACDSAGNHVLYYHVANHSLVTFTQVNLEMLAPNLTVPYAPNIVFTSIAPGATSPQLSTTIVGNLPHDTLCFRVHTSSYDSLGMEHICCYSDTQCVAAPHCPHDTACCTFQYLGDSVWCQQTPAGIKYNFLVHIKGCGSLQVQSPNDGTLNVSNPYALNTGVNDIYGSYISNTDTVLCLTFVMTNSGHICKDTTICFGLKCRQHPLPCHWDYNHTVCKGDSTFFGYYGSTAGLTITWSFTGGTPPTASGAGPHYVTYNTPGVYPFSMTLTDSNGTTTCSDSITVIAPPTVTITQTGNALNAVPATLYYQWYAGAITTPGIPGANNQYYYPPSSGTYCVVATDSNGCRGSACITANLEGINELANTQWNIYPNPNSGSFTLSLNLKAGEQVEMSILNVLGEVIDYRVLDTKTGSQQYYISNSQLSSGIYFVELKTGDGLSVKRMMIQ